MKSEPQPLDKNALTAFADWTAGVPNAWPESAIRAARRAFIDTLACMIGGAGETVTRTALTVAKAQGSGSITVIGAGPVLAAPAAALVNGTAAHALDFDDNFDPAKAHASAVLVPAILALGEDRGITGGAAIDAYIVGLQILGKLGQAMNPFHRQRGWHATATLGTVAAAAAAARIIGLNATKSAHAMSLATSLAGGFMSQFGTMTKPLHAGLGAEGGVRAALFAEAGITAGAGSLDGPHGMGRLMVGPDVEDLRERMAGVDEHGQTMRFATDNIGTPLHILEYGLKVKRFANCGSVHRALDGLLELRAAHGFDAGDVTRILVRAPQNHLANLMYVYPASPAEAKFSLEYGLALGLLTGDNAMQGFTEEGIANTKVLALIPLIEKEGVDMLESEFHTEVTVTLASGETHATSVDFPVGAIARPLTDDQLWQKFDTCAGGTMANDRAAALKQALSTFGGDEPLSELIAGLAF